MADVVMSVTIEPSRYAWIAFFTIRARAASGARPVSSDQRAEQQRQGRLHAILRNPVTPS
jgi:hypothetical protein